MMPAEKGPDPLIGQLVGGRFRVTSVLGEGGMGVVYVGEQQMGSTVRKVAIKTLHAHLSKDPSVLARFHRECGTVAQLEHPNTIKVYDFGSTSEGTLYIAMEFVAGRPLAEVIRGEGALASERVVHIMRQVCGALDEAHQTGIIHRDLKPENVILTKRAGEDDFVKLLDFGIAARSESADAQKEQKLTQQGMVLGTPPYMSPEQFTGKALDARSDIYSLGVMAYEMLTGRLPFDADTPWQWATQHMTAQPLPFELAAPSKAIPATLRQAILRSLSKEREQRQANTREFFAELSEGSRLTLDAAPPVAVPKTGTMGMEAPPNFAAPNPGAGAPEKTVATPMGVAMPAPAQPAHLPVPPPQVSRGKQGGGKGLIASLAGVGVLLLVAMGVVAARSLKSDDTPIPTIPVTGATGTSSEPVTIKPLESAAVETPPAPTEDTPAPTPAGTAKPTSTAKPAAPSTAKPPGTSATTPVPNPPTATPTVTPPSGSGNCGQCSTLAGSGDYAGAVSVLRNCTDATQKAQCTAKLRQYAGQAAKKAAQANNCSQANAIVDGVKVAGVDVSAALKNTPCAR